MFGGRVAADCLCEQGVEAREEIILAVWNSNTAAAPTTCFH